MSTDFVDALIDEAKKTPYFHLKGYMERYWLVPFNPDSANARIHHILRSDNDRALHDHPWDSISIILKGGYWEILPLEQSQHPELDSQRFQRIWRKPGDVVSRKAGDRHRIEVEPGTTSWSLFFMGPLRQQWGFYSNEGKVYWREYLNDYETQTASDGANI